MKRLLFLAGLAVVVLCAGGSDADAAPAARVIASPEPGWPQWRGPQRDGISTESGLLEAWPEGGPKVLWKADQLGNGYSCPIIADGKIFITGETENDLVITALDLSGKPVWTAKNGFAWKGQFPGSRAACAYSAGRLYHLNAHGRLACLETGTGKEVWAVEVLERFSGKNITWALSECLLVDDRKVYVTAGGDKALMAALNKQTGETVWASEPLLFVPKNSETGAQVADRAGYASPILFELAGRRHLVNCSETHAFGVDADTGKLLWSYPLPTTFKVLAATPALYGDGVFVTGPDSQGGTLLRIKDEKTTVTVAPAWISKLDTCQGGVIVRDDMVVGPLYRGRKGWLALDAKNGETKHHLGELIKGAALYASGRYYLLCEDGVMALVKLGTAGFEVVSRFKFVARHKNDVWAHPVILNGCLYLRYHDALTCFDLKAAGG